MTAPSFGPVHTRKVTRRGHVIPCRCGDRHHPADPRLATAVDPDTYDYTGAVLWQAHAGALWARFTTTLRRALAAALGVGARDFPTTPGCPTPRSPSTSAAGSCTSTPSSASTAPTDPPTHHPPRSPTTRCATPSPAAARAATLTTARPDGTPLVLALGHPARPPPRHRDRRRASSRTRPGEITDAALAGYIAKYATKSTGAVDGGEGADRPIRDGEHIAYLDVSPHHRRMIDTAWQLGDLPQYERAEPAPVGAHARLPRPLHDQDRRAYSITFTAIRAERRTWRLRTDLDQLAADTDNHGDDDVPVDLDTITVVNDWRVVHIGHRDHAERELALAIAERNRTQRRTSRTTRRAA